MTHTEDTDKQTQKQKEYEAEYYRKWGMTLAEAQALEKYFND